jgi:penicillin-binding protein 2
MFPRKRKPFSLRRNKRQTHEIAPEDIFLDAENLPEFDSHQFEGRIEKPINKKTVFVTGLFFLLIGTIFFGRAYFLQIKEGEAYAARSENNRLHHTLIFADRGIIEDRNGMKLAWNMPPEEEGYFSKREYTDMPGMYNLLGYVKYPAKDNNGFFYKEDVSGQAGVEKYFNSDVSGKNGLRIVETNALGKIESHSTIRPPEHATSLKLTIDGKVNSALFRMIKNSSEVSGFRGGAGVIMDIYTGEVLAMTTYPEYDSDVMSDGTDVTAVSGFLQDPRNSLLNRSVSGVYAPGSIVKPFLGLAVLNEGIISAEKKILSTGSISIPNPYFPDKPTVFRDWKAHGWTDLREAIAVSSDVYFYTIGGGFGGQQGLGISKIDEYMSMFGFGSSIQDSFFSGHKGVIPTPEWKKANFNGDIWRVGDTYNTSIGQFGFQVTPIQAVRAVAAIANNGNLVEPVIKQGQKSKVEKIEGISLDHYQIVKEGMRMAVTQGTMTGLNFSFVKVAGKTGTAELGAKKEFINSWATGYFPYDNPRYAFAVVLERGPAKYKEGAQVVVRNLFLEMAASSPEYFK